MRPPRHHSRPREAGARDTTGAVRVAGARRPDVEETPRPLDVEETLQLESFISTKLTKPLVRQLSRPTGQLPKRCAPDVRGRNHFWAGEARISEIEEEARHPLDGHPTATAA